MGIVAFFRRVPVERILWWSSIALAGCVGLLFGAVWSFFVETAGHPPRIVSGSGAEAASIVLEGFRDGALRGHAAGQVRLFAQDDAIQINADGAFSIVHPSFRIEEVTIVVPPGMRFVASKKGKKYYPVASAGGERITPENRVYFPNEAAAAAAGFTP